MASVVVLPEPVDPVTRIKPSWRKASRMARARGNDAHSHSGMADGTTRRQAPSCPPLWKKLVRKRETPPATCISKEKSTSFWVCSRATASGGHKEESREYISVASKGGPGISSK